MEALERLLSAFAKRRSARWWIGKRPDVREGQVARAIAGILSYPTSADDPFAGGMVRLGKRQAAQVLAVAGTTSLAYEDRPVRQAYVRDAALALNELGKDAVFLSNGLWDRRSPLSWTPLTSATFDCGLIAYDAENAFIFWVEEED